MEFKQAIIIRTDLKMKVGKKCAQACHACLIASNEARGKNKQDYRAWQRTGQKKIVLKVPDLNTLLEKYNHARQIGLPASIIQDAGLTQLEPGTTTAIAIGPAPSERIDKICGMLKLL